MTEFISKEEYEKRKKHIEDLQKELDQYAVEKEWWETEDVLKVDAVDYDWVKFDSNYPTWEESKKKLGSNADIMGVSLGETFSEIYRVAIGLDGMIELRDYLSQKIEYLQSK